MAKLTELNPSLHDALGNPPQKGNRNAWLFMVAKRARYIASPEKVKIFLNRVADRWKDRDFSYEIDRAVERAYSPLEAPSTASDRAAWPEFNPRAWERRVGHPCPFSEDPIEISSEGVINKLFPGDCLICAAVNLHSSITQNRGAWRGKESSLQFIVANPMTAQTGLNQAGKISARCLDNATKARIYQVIEFDYGSFADQASIIASLSNKATPLVLAVWSGGKSLHGWFHVAGLSEYEKLRFFRHAVFLGADASLWDPSKLVRMPGGRRDNGKTQDILYFNPNPF